MDQTMTDNNDPPTVGIVRDAVEHLERITSDDAAYPVLMRTADLGALRYVLDFVKQFGPTKYHHRHVEGLDVCPVCHESCMRCGITDLAYTYVVCSCELASYDHLAEQLYHSQCIAEGALDHATGMMLRDASQSTATKIENFLDGRIQEPPEQEDPS